MLRQITSSVLLSALFLTTISQTAFAHHPENSNRRRFDVTGNVSNHKTSQSKEQSAAAFSHLPVIFEANHGQCDDSKVNFIARNTAADYSLLLKPAEAVFIFSTNRGNKSQPRQSKQQSSVLRMKLQGANQQAAIEARGLEPQAGKINYLRANESREWQTGIETFSRVEYHNVYHGVDLQYYSQQSTPQEQQSGQEQQLEYDFIVSPRADYKQIKLRFEGASNVEIEPKSGDLLLTTKAGILRQHRPIVYQESARDERSGEGKQEREIVESRYVKLSQNEVGFAIGEYDQTRRLVIDPTLAYSSYLGGQAEDEGNAIAVDSMGNTYITGGTKSADFPTANPLFPLISQPPGSTDAFITKINASGVLIYSTYLGGNSYDYGKAIAVDSAGNAYVTGITYSTNFPTINAVQSASGGNYDAFVTKISANGQQLVYSTYLGASNDDQSSGIAVDSAGNAYVTGVTTSSNFPTRDALQPVCGSNPCTSDAFVTKISASGQQIVYSTYLGGTQGDSGSGIAVDAAGNAYVTGTTTSSNFPTRDALQPVCGSGSNPCTSDAFVTKISASGQQIVYSTYLGGSNSDYGRAIAVNSAGNAYVTGSTISTNFPTSNALQPVFGGGGNSFNDGDAFVTKISSSGQQFVYSTNLGGSSSDRGSGIAVDAIGNAYITGDTSSLNFPTRYALQSAYSGGGIRGGDAFVTKINSSGQLILYSTYFGSSGGEEGRAIAIDSAGNVYLTGFTASTNFPTSNAFQPYFGGGCCGGGTYPPVPGLIGDGFVTKISGFGINSPTRFDFDGDGRADLSVFRPSESIWYLLSSTQGFSAAQFGQPTDRIAPADFDGDGRTDIAVFRNGVWYWLNSSNNTFNAAQFGQTEDVPVPADYTGDGRAELAVYRAGVWYILNLSNNQYQVTQWGGGADITVPADFDGDGKTDIAVYRPSNGTWYWQQSSNGAFQSVSFGTAATPVVGDYDGDGRADQAVYLDGTWAINRSSAGFTIVPFGVASDRPVPADYDGDGKTDIAIYRDGVWWLRQSERGQSTVQFGTTNDRPIPSAFIP